MRRLPALVTVVGLTAAGCGFSSVDPDSTVSISGRALDASGSPLADAHVVLIRQADVGQVVFGTILSIGTLSTICFAPAPPAICEKARTTTTDADGRYHFEIKGSDTHGSLGTEATMNLAFSGPSSATATSVSFVAEENDVTVPDARSWDLSAQVRQGPSVAISWRPLPKAAGTKPSYSVQLYAADKAAVLWTEQSSGGRAEVDARFLEDKRGAVAVGATASLSGGTGAGDVRAGYLSARLPVRPSAGAPPSRGTACGAVVGTGPTVGELRTPCAETDGVLDRPAQLDGPGTQVVTGVVVDLGRAKPVNLVVARGFSGQFLVEASTDGKEYRTFATGTGPAYAARPTGRVVARYVRLRSPVGLDQSLSSEVSVW